jgi:hypothetical protein
MLSVTILHRIPEKAYALMAMTMPFWQWSPFVWLQYTHIGFSSLTVTSNLVDDALSAD